MLPRSIVITGANGQVGTATLDLLCPTGARLIAFVRSPRNIPGCEVLSDWMTNDAARAAMLGVEAVIHLAGTLNPRDHDYESANISPTERLISLLRGSSVRRLVFLSYLGASKSSTNAYLRSKATAEHLLKESGVPLTVLRASHIIGDPMNPGPTAKALLAQRGGKVSVLGTGTQKVAPVYRDDVARAIVKALAAGRDGSFDLQGPEQMLFDDLVRIVNRDPEVSIVHVSDFVAKLLRFVGPKLPPALVEVMAADSVSDAPSAVPAFELAVTSLREVWKIPGQAAQSLQT